MQCCRTLACWYWKCTRGLVGVNLMTKYLFKHLIIWFDVLFYQEICSMYTLYLWKFTLGKRPYIGKIYFGTIKVFVWYFFFFFIIFRQSSQVITDYYSPSPNPLKKQTIRVCTMSRLKIFKIVKIQYGCIGHIEF